MLGYWVCIYLTLLEVAGLLSEMYYHFTLPPAIRLCVACSGIKYLVFKTSETECT